MPKIHPYKLKKLGMDFNGKPVIQMSFKGNFTQNEIMEYVQRRSDAYKQRGMPAQIQTNVRWAPGKRGWRSSAFTNVGEAVDWHDDQDWYEDAQDAPSHFSEFKIYLLKI
jgi:hypothetical protein